MTKQTTTTPKQKLISRTTRFDRDLRRLRKRGAKIEKLRALVESLASGERLSRAARPHKLTGMERNPWEAHVGPDWLLIYEICEDHLILRRTGTHSDLFK